MKSMVTFVMPRLGSDRLPLCFRFGINRTDCDYELTDDGKLNMGNWLTKSCEITFHPSTEQSVVKVVEFAGLLSDLFGFWFEVNLIEID